MRKKIFKSYTPCWISERNKCLRPTSVPVAQLPHFRQFFLFFRQISKVHLQLRPFKRGLFFWQDWRHNILCASLFDTFSKPPAYTRVPVVGFFQLWAFFFEVFSLLKKTPQKKCVVFVPISLDFSYIYVCKSRFISTLFVFAERTGFEPVRRFWRLHAFQACLFNHSSTSLLLKPLLKMHAKVLNFYK